MKRKLENLRLGAGVLSVIAIAPLVAMSIIIKEEVIDRITGEYKRRENETNKIQKRYNEEDNRIKLRKELYYKWKDNFSEELTQKFLQKPSLLQQYTIEESMKSVGGSFWSFPEYYTNAVLRSDGGYNIEKGPGDKEKYIAHYTIDTNKGNGYSLEEASKIISEGLVARVLESDFPSFPEEFVYSKNQKIISQGTSRKKLMRKVKDDFSEKYRHC